MPPVRVVAPWIAVGLLVVLFLLQGGMKLAGASHEVQAFTERWGYPLWFMYVVGTLEVAGAVGLLIPKLRPLAASGLFLLMLGAIATHVRVGEWMALPLPVVAAGLAAWVAWEWRTNLPFGRKSKSAI